MSAKIFRSLHTAEDVSQDTSGLPLEGGEAVSANIRGTTTKPVRQHPPHSIRTNETDLRSYLPVYICPAFKLALDLYLVSYGIMTPHALSEGSSLLLPHAFVYLAIVCSIRMSIFRSCNVFSLHAHSIVVPCSVPDSERRRVLSTMKRPRLPASDRLRSEPTDPIGM